jgi:hypothetical protein
MKGVSTVADFGRVGRIRVPANATYKGDTDCTFMVVAQPSNPMLRVGSPGYRRAIVLKGYGYDPDRKTVGDLGAINLDDQTIEWLDD